MTIPNERVFVLGAGRAGRGLTRALRVAGVEVVGLHGRHLVPGEDVVTVGRIPDGIARATVIIVTVRDAQLEDALRELGTAPMAAGAIVLHASGSVTPSGLEALRARGHPAGTFHPLVPFVDPARAPVRLRGAWIGIDGDGAATRVAAALAESVGARALEIPHGEKSRYHAAAVVVANFPAVLLATGERLLEQAGVPAGATRDALLPLLVAAVENLRARPASEAMTGPIVRGDVDTVRGHLAAIAGDDPALAIYKALSLSVVDLARSAGTDAISLAAISEMLRAE